MSKGEARGGRARRLAGLTMLGVGSLAMVLSIVTCAYAHAVGLGWGLVPSATFLSIACFAYLSLATAFGLLISATSPVRRRLILAHGWVGIGVVGLNALLLAGYVSWSAYGAPLLDRTELEEAALEALLADIHESPRPVYVAVDSIKLAPDQLTMLRKHFPQLDLHDYSESDTTTKDANIVRITNVVFPAWRVAEISYRTRDCFGTLDLAYMFDHWHRMGNAYSCRFTVRQPT